MTIIAPNSMDQLRPHRLLDAQLRNALFLAFLLLGGCAGKIKELPESAEVEVPGQWQIQIRERGTSEEQDDAPQTELVEVEPGWLVSFADEDLRKYVQIALDSNPDLLNSAAQLRSAIEQVTINGSSLWPNIRADLSRNEVDNKTDGVTTEIRTVSGTLDVSWEADVWGKLSQRKKIAAFTAQSQAELFKAAELSLVANVSRAWFQPGHQQITG